MKRPNIFLTALMLNKINNDVNKFNKKVRNKSRDFFEIILLFFTIFFYVGFKMNWHKYELNNKITAIAMTVIPALIFLIMVFTDFKRRHPEFLSRIFKKQMKNKYLNYDILDGHGFERFCADILKKNGFNGVNVTKASGDQGIDIIANKKNKKYGFQCKCYSKPVGNKAVQEAYAGAQFYNCDYAAVITNQTFTKSAIELARKLGVMLYDRNGLEGLIHTAK